LLKSACHAQKSAHKSLYKEPKERLKNALDNATKKSKNTQNLAKSKV